MKRLLALTLLTTAISVPAFAETSLNTGASTGIVGIDAAALREVGADVDTSNSINTSNDSEDVGSTGTSSSGMSSSMSSVLQRTPRLIHLLMLTHHPVRRLVQPLKLTATHLPAPAPRPLPARTSPVMMSS
jgi:hypothetical protein